MGEDTSFVRVGGPRGEVLDVGGGWVAVRCVIGGKEGRERGGSWFICEGIEEGTYDGMIVLIGVEITGIVGIDIGMPGGVAVLESGMVGIIMGVSVGGPAGALARDVGPGLLEFSGGRGEPVLGFIGEPGFIFMGEPGCMGEPGDLGMVDWIPASLGLKLAVLGAGGRPGRQGGDIFCFDFGLGCLGRF